MAEFIEIHPDNIDSRLIIKVGQHLRNDGVIVYPTDTVYAFGCKPSSRKAFERICKIKNIDPSRALFSLLCSNISMASNYVRLTDTALFRFINRNTPGPFTFILNSTNELGKLLPFTRKTIGIRIPENNITLALIENLEMPILTTSVINDDEILEYYPNPFEIYEKYEKNIDLLIDGGLGNIEASGLIDCTGDEPVVIREGISTLR
jgi:tRNA threonylcarbamoyl adenosine modification protein (Sua5/YciO/YrdC/YwlC family)